MDVLIGPLSSIAVGVSFRHETWREPISVIRRLRRRVSEGRRLHGRKQVS
jgi:hypothetical protein